MPHSVRRVATDCVGAAARFSITRDVFGFAFGSPVGVISTRRQLELASGPALDVNLILVVPTQFSTADFAETTSALQIMRDIFAAVSLGIRRVNWQQISAQDAGAYLVINSGAEAHDLTDDFNGPDGALDVFVVRTILGADGWSAVGGPCTKDDKDKMTGSVVSLNGSFQNSGNTFAHEVGHYLGLVHCEDDPQCTGTNNFILSGSDSNTSVMAHQGQKMRTHCYVSDKC